ncbi:hypothetical protein [Rummeliibacillus pycnus]|uniref:hypothetical protein n=1 Tax=Rummeliibacillus pycnus TaxID=101070 RepID=UPI000C9C3B13|nr:hypothetical protein [Rummeliibacillus pycnus]
MKRFVIYLVWVIIIGFAIYCGLRFMNYLANEAEMSFETYPLMIFTYTFPILTGILLRLPKFFAEKKGKKKWSFDWVKLITIGFPALYLTVLPILNYSSYGDQLLFAHEVVLLGDTTILTTITGVIFGYVLLDSVKM